MNSLRKLELVAGITTGLLGLVIPLTFEGIRFSLPKQYYLETLIIILLFFTLPGVLFALSIYFHAVRYHSRARIISLIIGGFYLLSAPFLFFLGGYGGGWKQAFIVVLPAVTAIITLIISRFDKLK